MGLPWAIAAKYSRGLGCPWVDCGAMRLVTFALTLLDLLHMQGYFVMCWSTQINEYAGIKTTPEGRTNSLFLSVADRRARPAHAMIRPAPRATARSNNLAERKYQCSLEITSAGMGEARGCWILKRDR